MNIDYFISVTGILGIRPSCTETQRGIKTYHMEF